MSFSTNLPSYIANNKSLTIRLSVFDVGQGDTIVISSPDTSEAIVVDCIDANQVASYLEEQNIQHLRGVIITHLHDDHFSAVSSLIENCLNNPNLPNCERLLYNYLKPSSATERQQLMEDDDGHSRSVDKRASKTALQRLVELAKSHKIPTAPASLSEYHPETLPLKGELAQSIFLLHPHHNHLTDRSQLKKWNLNNLSVTLLIQTSVGNALLTGDLEPDGWDSVIASGAKVKSDVLKLPHHGAWKRNDAVDFIQSVSPSIALISVGTDNTYDHPNNDIFSALSTFPQIRLLCTQATNRCGASVLSKREIIKNLIVEESKLDYLVNHRGCACAGTTIIELGTVLRVIQPSVNLHVDQIVKPNFTSHQCVLPK